MNFKHRWINIVFSFVFVFSLLGTQTQQTVAAKPVDVAPDQQLLLQAACLDGNRGRMSAADSFTGQTQFIGTVAGEPIRVDQSLKIGTTEDIARSFLTRCGSLFGIQDESNQLTVKKERLTEDGQRTTIRFQQEYQGIPVIAGELFVQLNGQKDILAVGGEILPKLYVDTTPTTDSATAQQNALDSVAKQYSLDAADLSASEPVLKIYDAALLEPWDGPTLLVWEMEVTSVNALGLRQYVLVNAQRGNVVVSFNKLHAALDLATYDNNGAATLPPAGGSFVCDETNLPCTGAADTDSIAAHKGAANTYNYYFTQHGRDSIDGAGMQIVSVVDWFETDECPNAFWNGAQMVYCDGVALGDDVVGHELTHGVTDHESGLFYYYQSGAINESFSDVWGEIIDQTSTTGLDTDGVGVDWLLAEDVSAFAPYLRNMADPSDVTAFSGPDPDKMSSVSYNETVCVDATTLCDSGGVHSNSGVNNKAAYLMVVGGTFNSVTVTAIGSQKTTAIYYEVQTELLTSGSDYRDLHDALYQACQNLVGTTPPGAGTPISTGDCDDGVLAATEAVEMDDEPAVDFHPDAPVCDSDTPFDLFSDDMESTNYNWNYAGINNSLNTTDYQRWFKIPDAVYSFGYAHSGVSSIYGDDYDYDGGSWVSDTFTAMRSRVYIPASMPNAYLRFEHAYGFEGGFDGGVIEYSLNNGSTWADAGSMIDSTAYDYNGVIADLIGPSDEKNPLANRPAFVDDSHGYISSRLDLSSLIGTSPLFRWRMGTDKNGFDWGWWIDDVRVYSCLPLVPTIVTETFKSEKTRDGWVLEGTETKNKGGSMNSTTQLFVGDDALDRQFRSILSFNTASLPDNAVILSATLKLKQQSGFVGQNPFGTHGDLVADTRWVKFGTSPNLQNADFQAAALGTAAGPFNPTVVGGWRSANIDAASLYIYPLGLTQFRLRFTKDDNDDHGNDYVRFYAGEKAAQAPQLIVEYYIP